MIAKKSLIKNTPRIFSMILNKVRGVMEMILFGFVTDIKYTLHNKKNAGLTGPAL
jgi:hypothetical protein